MFASSLRHPDHKAAQILGVDLARDNAANPSDMRTRIVHVLKKAIRDRRRNTPSEPGFRWDVPNPFATPDPPIARVQALLRAEIARAESIAPHERDPLLGDIAEDHEDDHDTASVDYTDVDADDEYEDDMNVEEEDYYTDMEDEDCMGVEDEIAPIALPRLLPIPLRFIPSPTPSSPADEEEEEENKDTLAPWADLAQVYDSIAEGEERARKARRDLYRSRQKLLAILGPEASSAL